MSSTDGPAARRGLRAEVRAGARITATLVHALHQRGARYGLQVICEAGGQANATLLERLPA